MKVLSFLFEAGGKSLRLGGIRMQRTMMLIQPELMKQTHRVPRVGREIRITEPLPQYLYRHIRGMQHIRSVITIIPQFVEEELITREIGGLRMEDGGLKMIDRLQKDTFGYLVLVQAVLLMADGRNGKDPLLIGIAFEDRTP